MARSIRRLAGAALLVVAACWVGIPATRAALLVEIHGGDSIRTPSKLSVRSVEFSASDGVMLHGWIAPTGRNSPIVILVPGFKADRISMLPYARFLHAGGYNVLLYDSRGTGESDGRFTVGAREVDDILGAITFAYNRLGLRDPRIGLLGVSLGAGDVIVAAGRDRRVQATVADSAFTDQDALMSRLDQLHIVGPITIPLAPLASFVVDHLGGTTVSTFRPIRFVGHISPRAILLIHARHDTNPTTPLAGALALLHAARPPASLWIAPRGGHAGALAAQPTTYQRRVLRFLPRYLGR